MDSTTVQSTHTYILDEELPLLTPQGPPLTVHGDELRLSAQGNIYTECRLIMTVNPQVYEAINQGEWLNLKQGLRRQSVTFTSDRPLEIEARLDNGLLPYLAEQVHGQGKSHLGDGEAVAQHLLHLSQTNPRDPLLATESWYGLKVTQAMPVPAELGGSLRQGYTTTWLDNASEPPLESTAKSDVKSDIKLEEPNPLPLTGPIYTALIKFFSDRQVPFSEWRDRNLIQLEAAGDDATWLCFAEAQEETHRCALYSRFPESAPEATRTAVAYFLTRANYNLPLGCFELDLEDGEVRFRTTIDVTGDRLSPALIDNLLTANWSIMNKYFMGIQAVMRGEKTPEGAISAIES